MSNKSQPLTGIWYQRLKPNDMKKLALFSKIPRHLACSYFLVYSMSYGEENEEFREYGAFASSVDFYNYFLHTHKQEFHEIVLGERPQKFRVDVDLTPEKCPDEIDIWTFGNTLRDLIIEAISETLLDYKINIDVARNILYCTSHSSDFKTSKSKFSAHIILADYYHYNYEEALYFFDKMIEKNKILEQSVKDGIIDRSIYSTNHSMRLLGSTKKGERIKSFVSKIKYKGECIEFQYKDSRMDPGLSLFRRTCITDVIGCSRIPVELPPKINKKYDNVNLPEGYEQVINDMLNKYEGPGIYEIKSATDSGIIDLGRKHPSMCKICRRVHDKIDPFLRIASNGVVYYYCRQSKGKKGQKHDSRMIGLIKTSQSSSSFSSSESVEIKEQEEKEEEKEEEEETEESMFSGCDYDLLRQMSKETFRYPMK